MVVGRVADVPSGDLLGIVVGGGLVADAVLLGSAGAAVDAGGVESGVAGALAVGGVAGRAESMSCCQGTTVIAVTAVAAAAVVPIVTLAM